MQKLAKIVLLTLLTSAVSVAAAAPVGYSINSDSGSNQADSLFRIDLATGDETWVGPVSSFGEARIDVEGLAFAPDGTLYGIDDQAMTLFPLNPDNGMVQTANEVQVKDLPFGGNNDFGMTFACDGNLYITSVTRGALYRLDLDGKTTLIGNVGSLGANISALAAHGDPVKLYGLGNGLDANLNEDSPAIFEIDISTGVATQLFSLAADPYAEGGLSFDDSGMLWAITDRRSELGAALPSQVLKIDLDTQTISTTGNTSESGFESLAITLPRGCKSNGGENAEFKVQKEFVDGNQDLPTTLNIKCNAGLPLEQSLTTQPGSGIEVTFTVTDFQDGELDCEIWETTSEDYFATYECFSTGTCAPTASSCTFTDTGMGQDNLCVIRNYPESVQVSVTSQWVDEQEMLQAEDAVMVDLYCRNILGGDGEWSRGGMVWSWLFHPDTPARLATLQPGFDGSSECRTETHALSSAIESTSSCEDWTSIFPGAGPLGCTVTHTAFFEGIPTLGRGGLLLSALLLLFTGMVFVRRF
ncbi:MAG: hypothetical protein V2I48_10680 [Xanthomonadales bacterium]|jgi:hypothetical protein|nr:hypothetical protein [Xanthomonadales bacterium]